MSIVVLKLLSIGEQPWTYARLAAGLDLRHIAVVRRGRRALSSQLAIDLGGRIVPNARNLQEFLVHGLKYVFVPERGEMTRGIPTGYAAPVLRDFFSADDEPQPVGPTRKAGLGAWRFAPL